MLGTNRVRSLTPVGCNGNWEHPVAQIFGFTLYDTVAPPSVTLDEVRAYLTSPTGVETEEVVHNGAAFVAPWNGVGSAWGGGVMTMDRGAIPAGTQIRFRVKATDGSAPVNLVSYMSWYVGIGDAPKDPVPVIGTLVRTQNPTRLWHIRRIDGVPGDMCYVVECCDRTVVGNMRLKITDFEVVGPRDRMDDRIVVSE